MTQSTNAKNLVGLGRSLLNSCPDEWLFRRRDKAQAGCVLYSRGQGSRKALTEVETRVELNEPESLFQTPIRSDAGIRTHRNTQKKKREREKKHAYNGS